ncbi:hypothetical protein K4L44_06655 [Halosquirtibacter laminarini]|uniref:Uncharacterized protein n=1 Tax=Halosquirtibacter laminarini TaxID=3374600 RepID=A0AC61NII4_9BACT|nr:hypothetical protein K4L44_06655 [Prolixibacteraceae bacterium]
MTVGGDGTKDAADTFKSGSVDIYYQKVLPNEQEVLMNVVGNYYSTSSEYKLLEIATFGEQDTLLFDFMKSDKILCCGRVRTLSQKVCKSFCMSSIMSE